MMPNYVENKVPKLTPKHLFNKKLGKGEKEHYLYWCRKCNVEYQIESPKCFHCGKDTMKKEDRKAELVALCDVYKAEKDRRAEKKHKWAMWKKTKAMLWKKSATDYSKWEYFTDSENEMEELEKKLPPVLPEHDATFKAMEADLNDRKKKMDVERKKANELKTKANELMKKKDYFRAIELYSEAIE